MGGESLVKVVVGENHAVAACDSITLTGKCWKTCQQPIKPMSQTQVE